MFGPLEDVSYKEHGFIKQKSNNLFVFLFLSLRVIQIYLRELPVVFMETRDVNLICICMEGTRIVSHDSIEGRFSYHHVLHSCVCMCVGRGYASYTKELDRVGPHAYCGRSLLFSGDHDPT